MFAPYFPWRISRHIVFLILIKYMIGWIATVFELCTTSLDTLQLSYLTTPILAIAIAVLSFYRSQTDPVDDSISDNLFIFLWS